MEGMSACSTAIQNKHSHQIAGSDSGWMNSLPTILLRALFNVQVTITNIILKTAIPGATITLTCKRLVLRTAAEDWRAGLTVILPC